MKTSRKSLCSIACIASTSALFFFTASTILAEEKAPEKRVALKTTDGKYISTAPNGSIDLSGKAVTNRTVFAIVDSNGGKLEDGDEIKIKYYPVTSADAGKNKPSFWQEEAGKITRVNREPQGDAGKFKLKAQGESFVLQTASGKFAAAPAESGLGLADAAEGALAFTIEENVTAP